MLSARPLANRMANRLILATALLFSAATQAEVSAQLGVVSEYMRDGISETRGKYAAQAGAGYIHSSGFYGGLWGSEIKHKADNAHSEWDVYAGFSHSLTSRVGIDLGLTRSTFHGDWEADEKDYTDKFLRLTLDRSLVLGWRRTSNYQGSEFARRVLEASYTLHTKSFDFEFYTAQHRYMEIDDDYNFGNDNRDSYWHFRVGVERTYNKYDYRLTLERTNLTSDFDAGTTFQFGVHRYFDLW
ncbi:TorF family putative porin [Oceanobacter mangrovi]|uniref:TorF family putative porin n=1 Tax=Oceanobacter mangrovi TaxID=2862510 RepID=UPI001C8E1537|nr:TorF family putative porin [Oceanobacter mangrovi]